MPKSEHKKKDKKVSYSSLDEKFHQELSTTTKVLNDIWDRIGFNDETKANRLKTFFESLEETCLNVRESEEELEENISVKIKENRLNIRTICIELGNKNDEKFATGVSMLDEEKLLRERLSKLQQEKTKRLEEYKQYSSIESTLCERLKQKKTSIKTSVPTESEIEALKSYIKELEKMKTERTIKMEKYKNDIVALLYDLDMSQSDSFSELIIYESIEELPLSETDLERAKSLRDELKIKDEKLIDQIKSLKYKIKQLWTKLCFNNPELVEIVESNDEINADKKQNHTKTELINMLNQEHDRCLKTKMENLEKFIEQIRIEISVFYEKLYFSDTEIKKFDSFYKSKDFTEELLKVHEDKLEELKFNYDESQSLYDKTAKWLDFWQQFILFEEKTKDPNRFKVRGYNSLEEEKARKQFTKDFPKLEEELRRNAEEYSELNHKEYTIYGYEWKEYLDVLRKDYEKHKQNEKNEKKQQSAAPAPSKKDNFLYSKHASKIATPSFVKPSVKRKNIDQTPSLARQTKLQRTEIAETTVITSTAIPVGTPKVSSKLLMKGKATRKSRTPLKTRLRQKEATATNATKVNSNNTTTKSSTILSKNSASPKASKYKIPSKLQQNHENDESTDTTLTATISSKGSTTASSTVNASTYRTGGYPFKQIEINYQEFSRDLQKQPFKFKGNKNNGAASSATSNHADKDIKEKLTSTLIMS